MLEWHPRLIAVLALITLVALASATGWLPALAWNWEW